MPRYRVSFFLYWTPVYDSRLVLSISLVLVEVTRTPFIDSWGELQVELGSDPEVGHVTRTSLDASVARRPLRPFGVERYTVLSTVSSSQREITEHTYTHRSLLCHFPEPAGGATEQYSN